MRNEKYAPARQAMVIAEFVLLIMLLVVSILCQLMPSVWQLGYVDAILLILTIGNSAALAVVNELWFIGPKPGDAEDEDR